MKANVNKSIITASLTHTKTQRVCLELESSESELVTAAEMI